MGKITGGTMLTKSTHELIWIVPKIAVVGVLLVVSHSMPEWVVMSVVFVIIVTVIEKASEKKFMMSPLEEAASDRRRWDERARKRAAEGK